LGWNSKISVLAQEINAQPCEVHATNFLSRCEAIVSKAELKLLAKPFVSFTEAELDILLHATEIRANVGESREVSARSD
jgi:hypothetical protein